MVTISVLFSELIDIFKFYVGTIKLDIIGTYGLTENICFVFQELHYRLEEIDVSETNQKIGIW